MIHGTRIRILVSTLVLFASVHLLSAATAVKIFSKEEALSNVSMSTPRIYIQNTGTTALSTVKYYYYFTTENNKTPVLDLYYVTGHTVVFESMGNSLYRVSYTINSTVNPGQTFPNTSGNSVGLHYNDYSSWTKTNDYSENNSTSFVENTKIAVYVNSVLIYGTDPTASSGGNGDDPTPAPPLLSPQLLSFALFSIDSSVVKERSIFSGGGAVGSNHFTRIGLDAIIYGNVISGGNAAIMQRAHIYGDVQAAGVVTTDNSAIVDGAVEQGVAVGTITLPTRSITPGTVDVAVGIGGTKSLAPGMYRDLIVDRSGTVTLSPGSYVFRKIYLETDARIIFTTAFNELTSIDVATDITFSDRSTLTFSSKSYAPSVQIFTNDPDSIRIGTDVKLSGILIAPSAKIQMYSRAQCDGAIYAKTIILEPDSKVMSSLVDPNGDADGDSVPNFLEIQIGTDPTNPVSFKAVAIPNQTIIDNRSNVDVRYDPGVFYEDYTRKDTITINYPAGSLVDPYKSLVLVIGANSQTGSGAINGDYSVVSRDITVSGNKINDNMGVTITVPIPANGVLPGQYLLAAVTDSGMNLLGNSSTDYGYGGGGGVVSAPINNIGTYVIVRKNLKTVAYLDDGTVYSTRNVAKLIVDLAISGCQTQSSTPGMVLLTWNDLSNPASPVVKQKTINLLNDGHGFVTGNGSVETTVNTALQLTSLQITIPGELNSGNIIVSPFTVNPGQCFTVSTIKPVSDLRAQLYVPDQYVFSYSSNNLLFESSSINGEGIVRKYPNAANE
jgi:hypothetical protein